MKQLARAAWSPLFILALLAGCDSGSDARPSDLAVRFGWDFGVARINGMLELRNGRGRYEEKRGGNTVRFSFKPTPAQLDRVWRALRENKAVEIRLVDVEPVAGGDSETLAAAWGDTKIAISRTTAKRLHDEDQDRWRAIVTVLRGIIRAERTKRGLSAN